MAGKTLSLQTIVQEDKLATQIAASYVTWDMLRNPRKLAWKEIRQYVYATDTSQTTNSKLPWSNKTTLPKVCQIRDNLNSNYMAALFPKRKWLYWEADNIDAASPLKRDSILDYMAWTIDQPQFKSEIDKLVHDYTDYGDAFAMPEWIDERQEDKAGIKSGFVGPGIRRIAPLDIVFNPTAPNFVSTPKIIRSLTSLGEIKKSLQSMTKTEETLEAQKLFEYLRNLRQTVRSSASELSQVDSYYQMDGFGTFRQYLESDFVEVLTFYGDIYDFENDVFLENHVISIVDRHKIIAKRVNPSIFGYAPIFKTGWRTRQDNLWSMGPLDNLIGMQYRIDHIENLKADVFDLIAFPVLKIKGFVNDFEWKPAEKITVSEEGDVEMLAPPFQILQANSEIAAYMNLMEEMAGSPKEAMGFRTPGEKTAYEVSRLENAAARIFNTKIQQFEEQLLEPLLNGMLELARRNMSASGTTISKFSSQFNALSFQDLSPDDITGSGRIKPVAARHFAEQAELIQNMTNFYNSAVGQDELVKVHFSGYQTAKMVEDALNLKDFSLLKPFIRISEQTDLQKLQNAAQEQIAMEAQTASGLTPDDHDSSQSPPQTQVLGPASAGTIGSGDLLAQGTRVPPGGGVGPDTQSALKNTRALDYLSKEHSL